MQSVVNCCQMLHLQSALPSTEHEVPACRQEIVALSRAVPYILAANAVAD